MKIFYFILVAFFVIICPGCIPQSRLPVKNIYIINLAPNIYKISFNGTPGASPAVTQDYLLYKCAQLTLANNKKFFIILNAASSVNRNYISLPRNVSSYSSENYQGNLYGNPFMSTYNGYGNRNTFTTIGPGMSQEIDQIYGTIIIKLLSGNKNNSNAMDAVSIINSINNQYNVKTR